MKITTMTLVLSRPRRSKVSIDATCDIADSTEVAQKPEIVKSALTVLKALWFPNPVKSNQLTIDHGPEGAVTVALDPSVVAPFNILRNAAKVCTANGYKFNSHVDG